MAHGYKQWNFTVYDQDGLLLTDSNVMYMVCTLGTPTMATIYSDAAATAKTNPVVGSAYAVHGCIKFWTADSVATVDLFVACTKGGCTNRYNVTERPNKIVLDNDTAGIRTAAVPFTATAASATNSQDTGFDFPVGCIPKECFVIVDHAAGSGTLDVGTLTAESGGDPNGLIDGISVADSGVIYPYGALTSGSVAGNGFFTMGSNKTIGILLASYVAGTGSRYPGEIPVATLIESGGHKSLVYTWDIDTSYCDGWIVTDYQLLPIPRG